MIQKKYRISDKCELFSKENVKISEQRERMINLNIHRNIHNFSSKN